MIVGFKDLETEILFHERRSRKLPFSIQHVAYRKLLMIHSAVNIQDLRVPPGNRLERLKGDQSGRYSIRINDQWRISFAWKSGNASQVHIEDYH